ncbi:MAG: hypothetical protein OHK0053_24710 [Microscillaceae bacterium]
MSQVWINDTAFTLAELEKHLWNLLFRAAVQKKEAFHKPTLGTISAEGPSLRTLVLREVDAGKKILLAHTDRRSPKVSEIQADPRIHWHFYDERRGFQLRLSGKAFLHAEDSLWEAQWAKTNPGSRKVYASLIAPGQPSEEPASGLPPGWDEGRLSEEESELGKPNFMVIRSEISALDWLFLDARGHRRAVFRYHEGQLRSAQWLIP